ncbi:MAG: hypothetical protein LUI39_04420 [Lachnospiraceae bacterium]|nr:hypothetical protein [Lachnospiraceae bacterium]
MKRCIVCGNIGSDDSTVCSVCGNPFVETDVAPEEDVPDDSLERMEEQLKEMWAKVQGEGPSAAQGKAAEPEDSSEDAADAVSDPNADAGKDSEPQEGMSVRESVNVEKLMKAVAEKTAAEENQTKEAAETSQESGKAKTTQETGSAETQKETGTPDAQTAQRMVSRRKKGGPQIYGQESMEEYSGAQGVLRRDVQGGHAVNEGRTDAGETSGRLASRPPRRPAPASVTEDMAVQNTPADMSAHGNTPAKAQNTPENGAKPVPQQRMSAQPYPQPSQGTLHGGKHTGMARRIMEAARDALSSPLLIVVALLQTVYFASSVAAIFLRQLNYGQAAKLLALLPLPSQISGYTSLLQAAMAQLDSGALILNLVIRIPDLLFCIALWALCITARSSKEKMSGAGFLFMRISVILNMIAACAVLLVVLVVFVTFVIAAWNAGTTNLITLAVVLLVLAIVVTMAVLMYFFCYLATIKTIRKNAVNGERYGSASVYVALVKMVTALTAIISLLSGIVNYEITGITSGAGQLGFMILFGVWILKYRSTLREYAE